MIVMGNVYFCFILKNSQPHMTLYRDENFNVGVEIVNVM